MAVLGAKGQTGGKQKNLQSRFDNASEANKKRILARADKEINRLRKMTPKPDTIVGRRLQRLIDSRPNRKENFKKNPLKIDNKGLKPNVQVKKKAPVKKKVEVEKKAPVKTETRAEMLKRKTGSTYDPTKANRAGQRMGQRKAGGMIKKMAYGGKVKKMMGGGMAKKAYKHGGKVGKKCPRDGIAMRGKTRA